MKIHHLILLATTAMLVGCDQPSPFSCYQEVVKAAPEAEISPLPNASFSWLARYPDGSVRLIQCLSNTSPEVTNNVQLFKPIK